MGRVLKNSRLKWALLLLALALPLKALAKSNYEPLVLPVLIGGAYLGYQNYAMAENGHYGAMAAIDGALALGLIAKSGLLGRGKSKSFGNWIGGVGLVNSALYNPATIVLGAQTDNTPMLQRGVTGTLASVVAVPLIMLGVLMGMLNADSGAVGNQDLAWAVIPGQQPSFQIALRF